MLKTSLGADEYNKLVEQANKSLYDYPHLDPYDIVSDIVLKAIEKGEGLYLHELIKDVKSHAKTSSLNKTNAGSTNTGLLRNTKIARTEQTRVCAHCHEAVPISGFSVVRRKVKGGDAYNVITEILYNCNECQKTVVAERIKKNRAEKNQTWENTKAYQRKYMKSYRKSMTPEMKRARKEYAKKYAADPVNKAKNLERMRKYNERKRTSQIFKDEINNNQAPL